MGALTVKDLCNYLLGEMAKGHSDYVLFVTDDEEANGYHALWYLGETAKEIVKKQGKEAYEDYYKGYNHDSSITDDTKAIYLG